jgi:hypothetical protein
MNAAAFSSGGLNELECKNPTPYCVPSLEGIQRHGWRQYARERVGGGCGA